VTDAGRSPWRTVLLALLVLALLCALLVTLGPRVPVRRLVPALAGVLYLAMGRVIPHTRSDSWFGVRTPWTLSSDHVWTRTQRFAGVSMTSAGLLVIVAALALPVDLGVPVSLGAGKAAIVAPAVYSYLTWRRERQG
jgi:uncharacterized membrane protein